MSPDPSMDSFTGHLDLPQVTIISTLYCTFTKQGCTDRHRWSSFSLVTPLHLSSFLVQFPTFVTSGEDAPSGFTASDVARAAFATSKFTSPCRTTCASPASQLGRETHLPLDERKFIDKFLRLFSFPKIRSQSCRPKLTNLTSLSTISSVANLLMILHKVLFPIASPIRLLSKRATFLKVQGFSDRILWQRWISDLTD